MGTKQHLLFNPEVLKSYVREKRSTPPENPLQITQALRGWAEYVNRGSGLGELSLEQAFNQRFFVDILGYTQPPGYEGYFTFLPKTYALGGEGFPDFLLGNFKLARGGGELEKDIRLAVGELKSPGTDLDRIQPSTMKSPVEQAFGYALRNGLNLRWVIVSNMQEFRLYHQTSIDHFQDWRVSDFMADSELTEEFWTFYYLLQRDCLLGFPEPSRLEKLLRSSLSQRLRLTEDFYDFYRRIVHDTYLEAADRLPDMAESSKGRSRLVRASQLLIHRGLVSCYFSDHPSELLPSRALDKVIESALAVPSLSKTRVYDAVKDFFACLDTGSPDHYPLPIYGYDGGLFKKHPVADSIDLPDDLFTRTYRIGDRSVDGILGFRVFDFHADLNEHLLGRIFEESVGDMEAIHEVLDTATDPLDGLERRRDYGLFYTREGLASFLAEKALEDLLSETRAETLSDLYGAASQGDLEPEEEIEFLSAYLGRILDLRVADLACGSGAFLVSCYRQLGREARRVHSKLNALKAGQYRLEDFAEFESELLRRCIYGNDLMPEAVEISRLALWIASARKHTKLGGLEENFFSNDAIDGIIQLPHVPQRRDGFPQVDLIIGNPPWGGEVSEAAREFVRGVYPNLDVEHLDSYELFLLVALKYLKPGGRLAYVLPHTFLYPEHSPVRRYLLNSMQFERYHYLGADWFGPKIRMNTTILQIRNEPPSPGSGFISMTLVDEDRRKAIGGEASLAQLEEAYAFPIPQGRCIESGDLEPFRYVQDDEIMAQMQSHSLPLGMVCTSSRGVELGKDGHITQCPSCGSWDSPPRKIRGGGFREKKCNHCGHRYSINEALDQEWTVLDDPDDGDVSYVDGDSLRGRYEPIDYRGIRLGFDGIQYKSPAVYEAEKIFVRQAGVGLSVAIDRSGAYCPQSVYIYRLDSEAWQKSGISDYVSDSDPWLDMGSISQEQIDVLDHRFVLAVLNSRLMHYYVFKRFGEIDAAQAFAKLTHNKIRALPIPIKLILSRDGNRSYRRILESVDKMLTGSALGSKTDWSIDRDLARLYGLRGGQSAYVNSQLGLVAYHKAMRSLFPRGPPPPPQRRVDVRVSLEKVEETQPRG